MKRNLLLLAFAFLAGCESRLEIDGITRETADFKNLPQVMREFPTWEPVAAPVYGFDVRDGARRPFGYLNYRTTLKPNDIGPRVRDHVEEVGCTKDSEDRVETVYRCGASNAGLIILIVDRVSYPTSVSVLFVATDVSFEDVSF